MKILFIVLILVARVSHANSNLTVMHTIHDNIRVVKREINSLDATVTEKATLVAIASIETENMMVDYPICDNKQGASCNVGIYKANIDELLRIDRDVDTKRFHKDNKYAHKIMLQGIRKLGRTTLLEYHRGGTSIRGQVVIDYIRAIDKLTLIYSLLGFNDNIRYTIYIKPI